MNAAPLPRAEARLLHVDLAADTVSEAPALVPLLGRGDLLVVNDAATLPASLQSGSVEVRLLSVDPWRAVLFGSGGWRDRTEDRPAPPRFAVGDTLPFDGLTATVIDVDPRSPRLVTLAFDRRGDALCAALYRIGRPVQYSYLGADLALAAVQTGFAGRPWAMEMPSASRALPWSVLRDALRKGVRVAPLTHAAGLSATGDDALDAILPLPERFEIPAATWDLVEEADRVIAVGTTVARALEGAARLGTLAGVTDLVLDASTAPRVTHGLVSGIHAPGESHWRVLAAYVPGPLLARTWEHAAEHHFLAHEFGDATVVLPG